MKYNAFKINNDNKKKGISNEKETKKVLMDKLRWRHCRRSGT